MLSWHRQATGNGSKAPTWEFIDNTDTPAQTGQVTDGRYGRPESRDGNPGTDTFQVLGLA